MAGEDIFRALKDLPFRRFALAQNQRTNDLKQRLGVPGMADQYPGKQEPAAYSCIYGPITMQATRHTSAPGFNSLAPLVAPQTPAMPRDTNPLTGHDYAFYWCDTDVAAFIQWGYDSNPGLISPVPIDAAPLGDIFDPVMDNGGAQIWQNFSQGFVDEPRICFEIDLYDKKRGRSITDGRVPSEIILGGAYEFKRAFGPMRWDPDTEIEPRVYITEVKMTSALDTDQAFNAAQVAVYLNIAFRGYHSFSGHPSGAAY